MSDTPIIILGAGGHARVILDILLTRGDRIAGLTDPNADLHGTSIRGLPILGSDDTLNDNLVARFVVGIGDNRLRARLYARCLQTHQPAQAIHPRAVLSAETRIGHGVVIMANAVVNCDGIIGDNTIINTGATVDHDARIGSHVHIAPGAHLAGSITVEDGAFIGVGASLIPNVHIGAGAIVGAGAVVIRDVPAGATVVGVPARIIHSLDSR